MLMLLVILLVLNYSSGSCQSSISPTGGRTDSVLIHINYIRLANEKLIEGIRDKKIVSIQDSIINLQKSKYAELENEASVLQTKLYDSNKINNELIARERQLNRKVKFLGGTALASTLAFILCIILN